MLERLKDLPPGIEGLRAVGKVTKDDYATIVEPLIDNLRRQGRRARFLYEAGPEFGGITASAALEDAKIGLRSMSLFDGCAIVTDVGWLRGSARLAGFLMPCPVQIFGNHERNGAVEWLSSLPGSSSTSHRVLADLGVIVVEVENPLRVQDFDALATTANAWIEAHGKLPGIVIHAHAFPGWENISGLLHHIQFVRDHHRKIERVALAADSKWATLAPRIAEHFVQAEVKSFAYDALESAAAWAAGSTKQSATSSPAAAASISSNEAAVPEDSFKM